LVWIQFSEIEVSYPSLESVYVVWNQGTVSLKHIGGKIAHKMVWNVLEKEAPKP